MILDTINIKEGHSTIQQLSDLDSVKENLPPFTEKVVCNATIDRSGTTLYIQVQFTGSFELECARCLSKYLQPVAGDFRLILQEREGRSGPAGEDETADYYFDSNNTQVDISPLIFDEILTSLPLKPLCNENCKGIVFDTGINNRHETECDPRWEALKSIAKKNNKK